MARSPKTSIGPFLIEEVAMPDSWHNSRWADRRSPFPFMDLEPSKVLPDGRLEGPSIFVPDENELSKKARSMMSYTQQKTGRKFATRTVIEKGVQGTRFWRRPVDGDGGSGRG